MKDKFHIKVKCCSDCLLLHHVSYDGDCCRIDFWTCDLIKGSQIKVQPNYKLPNCPLIDNDIVISLK